MKPSEHIERYISKLNLDTYRHILLREVAKSLGWDEHDSLCEAIDTHFHREDEGEKSEIEILVTNIAVSLGLLEPAKKIVKTETFNVDGEENVVEWWPEESFMPGADLCDVCGGDCKWNGPTPVLCGSAMCQGCYSGMFGVSV